jgi:uncharacterized membrane protein
MTTLRRDRMVLTAALLALSALYVAWFRDDRHALAALIVFALPPALLAIGVLLGRRTASFWSGVAALFWFSHGVMLAWSEPVDRSYATIEILLALVVVFASSARGLMAKFGKRSS